MSKRIISGGNCCDCDGDGLTILPPPSTLLESFTVRSVPGIPIGNVINEYMESGKKIYELDYLQLVKPIVALTNDFPIIEVGETIPLVTFSGSIAAGTYPISSRSITPDPGGLDLTAPFSFQKANVKLSAPGFTQQHTLLATDDQGNNSSVMSRVEAKNAIYQGFSPTSPLNQAQIKAFPKVLKDNVLQEYGGEKTYVVPNVGSVPNYIFWYGPVGSTAIAAAILNGLSLPLTTLPPVTIANPHDGTIEVSYWGIRTTNRLDPGTYKIILS